VTWRAQLGDDFAAIRDQEALAATNVADVFAQPILELPQSDGLHVRTM
jgi:hypothetical protein